VTKLVNNGLLQENKIGRMFAVRPGPTYADAKNFYREDLERWDPIIERIADLLLRVHTHEAEIPATVHFTARSLALGGKTEPSEMDVFEEVRRWKQGRRPPLEEAEIARTIRSLNLLGWLTARPSLDLPLPEEALLDAQ
jgi:hypothetical protein